MKRENALKFLTGGADVASREDHEEQLVRPSRVDDTERVSSYEGIQNKDCEGTGNCLSGFHQMILIMWSLFENGLLSTELVYSQEISFNRSEEPVGCMEVKVETTRPVRIVRF